MNWQIVKPVLEPRVRLMCMLAYPGHPQGCPNFRKKAGCPPDALIADRFLDMTQTVWAVWNKFRFSQHVGRMYDDHPDWSERQAHCCLYWQNTARKQLERHIKRFFKSAGSPKGWIILRCPEANGVNVTETMHNIGIKLEWPPERYAYQVVLMGKPKDNKHGKAYYDNTEL